MSANNDLISRSALCGKQKEMYIHTDSGKIIPAMAIPVWVINNAPAVDAEPVRHGRWILYDVREYAYGICIPEYKCSECGRIEVVQELYCNCGAKMDAEENKCDA